MKKIKLIHLPISRFFLVILLAIPISLVASDISVCRAEHGISIDGKLKYKPGFKRFDYASDLVFALRRMSSPVVFANLVNKESMIWIAKSGSFAICSIISVRVMLRSAQSDFAYAANVLVWPRRAASPRIWPLFTTATQSSCFTSTSPERTKNKCLASSPSVKIGSPAAKL